MAAVRTSGASALVLTAIRSTALVAHATAISKLAERHAVFIAGKGADEEAARLLGATLLPPDPVAAAVVQGQR